MIGFSSQLREALAAPNWVKTADGYRFSRYDARLVRRETKRGRAMWFLLLAGKEHDLGRRATFDHAERIIAAHAR